MVKETSSSIKKKRKNTNTDTEVDVDIYKVITPVTLIGYLISFFLNLVESRRFRRKGIHES